MKIIVDKLPTKTQDCPFAIHCDDKTIPKCMLKDSNITIKKTDWISFGCESSWCTCKLSNNEKCDMLLEMSK